jgi:hypothetical protein
MPSPPEFSSATVRLLAERSAMICNNPRCATVTVGPSDAKGDLSLKLGEAAHIKAKRKKNGARFDKNMNDEQRADVSNGIWLCASCHTMVDKNNGADFTVTQLRSWKKLHEDMIRSLLLTHRSPVPLLRQFTEEGKVAQDAVDVLATHGALFVDMNLEVDAAVIQSIDRLRDELKVLVPSVVYDKALKRLLQDLYGHFRQFMNETSKHPQNALQLLPPLRIRTGLLLLRLEDEYGCHITSDLRSILP